MIDYNFRLFAGWDFSPEVGIVVAGGYTESDPYAKNTAEISTDYGATFHSLPNLPEVLHSNCIVIVGNKEPSV